MKMVGAGQFYDLKGLLLLLLADAEKAPMRVVTAQFRGLKKFPLLPLAAVGLILIRVE